ncbi:MAG: hypothetical protein MJ249_12295 [Kiritimatiellae bacterium]|nr:hypothetical protein [Kiritimatiellia bacterium]
MCGVNQSIVYSYGEIQPDPDPLVAGPDAHGTNPEWYNVVCSNVYAAVESESGIELLPRTGDVNTNAYYFVDVVAERGPAPIYFNSSHPGRLGSPVVVALAGETNRVPLLIGATYSVTSDVQFDVACPVNGFAGVVRDGGHRATVRWPLDFSFVEGVAGANRYYTVGVGPFDPGGSFSWGQGSGGACGCVSGNGTTVTFGCSSSCTCGGNCLAVGAYNLEHALFAATGGVCRCGFDDPPSAETPGMGALDEPSVSIDFSAPAVIFEAAYNDRPDVTQPLRSTRTRLTVSAWGGPNGCVLTLTSQNLGKLAPVACGPLSLPQRVPLSPYERWTVSYLCEGASESSATNDVSVSGTVTDVVSGQMRSDEAAVSSIRVEFSPHIRAPANKSVFRHKFGIGEQMNFRQFPPLPALSLSVVGGMENFNLDGDEDESRYVIWSFRDEEHSVLASWNGVRYRPLVSVVCPTGIETRNEHWETNGLPPGVAGGICVVQQYFVKPLDVSFTALSIEEVPCFDEIEPTGYFSVVTGKFQRTHTERAGAGRLWPVADGNWVIGEDCAGVAVALARVKPDGTETDDPQYGWLGGELTWKIPFGWQLCSIKWPMRAPPLGTFAEESRQVFTLTASGDFKIHKLGNEAERKIDGTINFKKGNAQ